MRGEGTEKGGVRREAGRGGEGRGERREGRGGLSGNVAEDAFCLKSAPVKVTKHDTIRYVRYMVSY